MFLGDPEKYRKDTLLFVGALGSATKSVLTHTRQKEGRHFACPLQAEGQLRAAQRAGGGPAHPGGQPADGRHPRQATVSPDAP